MKDIKDYEGLYAVTSCGRVWSYRSQMFLSPYTDVRGYLRVDLYQNKSKKSCKVHRLVAEAYIPNSNNLEQVNHKDENKQNNCINNLEWCDAYYNNHYGSHSQKISLSLKGNTRASKKVLCVETGIIYESGMDAYRRTGISNVCISHALNGKSKTAGGFHWRYADE